MVQNGEICEGLQFINSDRLQLYTKRFSTNLINILNRRNKIIISKFQEFKSIKNIYNRGLFSHLV